MSTAGFGRRIDIRTLTETPQLTQIEPVPPSLQHSLTGPIRLKFSSNFFYSLAVNRSFYRPTLTTCYASELRGNFYKVTYFNYDNNKLVTAWFHKDLFE